MTLPVTAFTAAICAIMLLILAIDTVHHRIRAKAAFGDHGDTKLISAARSHGNLAEHAPIVILMMAFLEMSRANHMALMAVGALFLAGRVRPYLWTLCANERQSAFAKVNWCDHHMVGDGGAQWVDALDACYTQLGCPC
jgi:uncharacterized membrane protein YecN with MAPEG domain